jgi:hypothetical protein
MKKSLLLLSVFVAFLAFTVHAQNATVTFNVRMADEVENETFDPAADFLDVAGTINAWAGGENYRLTAVNDDFHTYTITLNNVTAGAHELKFRINGDWATSEFPDGGPNRNINVVPGHNVFTFVYNEEGEVTSLTLNVRMQGVDGFDPATDFMDVAGSFNDWGNDTIYRLTALNDDFLTYTVTIYEIEAGAHSFKFRINGSWDTSEFPDGGPNRDITVAEGSNVFTFAYNVEGEVTVPVSVNELASVSLRLYPNPARESLNIVSDQMISQVRLINLMGQVVYNLDSVNSDYLTLSVSSFTKGVYIVQISTAGGVSSRQVFVGN